MTDAFAWIGKIAERIGAFIPQALIIDTRHGAVKWTTIRLRDVLRFKWEPSVKTSVHGPCFLVYWPLFSEVEAYPTAYQSMPLVAQDIVTKDDRTITARGMLAYSIKDLMKIQANTWDPEDTIRDIVATSFHDVLCHQTWADLKAGQGRALDTKLKNEAQKDLDHLGIEVHKFALTSLSPCRVLRVVQSTSAEGELK